MERFLEEFILNPARAPKGELGASPEDVWLLFDGKRWTFSFDPPTAKSRRYYSSKRKKRNIAYMVSAEALKDAVRALYRWKGRAEKAEALKWELVATLESLVDHSFNCLNCSQLDAKTDKQLEAEDEKVLSKARAVVAKVRKK